MCLRGVMGPRQCATQDFERGTWVQILAGGRYFQVVRSVTSVDKPQTPRRTQTETCVVVPVDTQMRMSAGSAGLGHGSKRSSGGLPGANTNASGACGIASRLIEGMAPSTYVVMHGGSKSQCAPVHTWY